MVKVCPWLLNMSHNTSFLFLFSQMPSIYKEERYCLLLFLPMSRASKSKCEMFSRSSFDKEEGGPLLNSQFCLQMAQHFKKTEANIITRPKGKQASMKQESPVSPIQYVNQMLQTSQKSRDVSLDASILILDDASEIANNKKSQGRRGERKKL